MGTSREGLTNSNSAEITSSSNQDYFWVFVLGFGCGLFFLFCFVFSTVSPLEPRGSEYITQYYRMHYTHLLSSVIYLSSWNLTTNSQTMQSLSPSCFLSPSFICLKEENKEVDLCFNNFNVLQALLTWKKWKGLEFSGRKLSLTCLSLLKIPSL